MMINRIFISTVNKSFFKNVGAKQVEDEREIYCIADVIGRLDAPETM